MNKFLVMITFVISAKLVAMDGQQLGHVTTLPTVSALTKDQVRAIQKINLVERQKKVLFLKHFAKLIDFESSWNKRCLSFNLKLPVVNASEEEIFSKYVELTTSLDEKFMVYLFKRAAFGVPHLKVFEVYDKMQEFLDAKKNELAARYGKLNNFKHLWAEFIYQLRPAIAHWCREQVKPNDAQEFLIIFKGYVDTVAYPRFVARLEENPENNREVLSAIEIMDLKFKILLTQMRAQTAELMAQFARQELEEIKA